MKQILTRSLFLGSEKSGFGLLFIEKLVCFWSVFSKFWSVLIIGDTDLVTQLQSDRIDLVTLKVGVK